MLRFLSFNFENTLCPRFEVLVRNSHLFWVKETPQGIAHRNIHALLGGSSSPQVCSMETQGASQGDINEPIHYPIN